MDADTQVSDEWSRPRWSDVLMALEEIARSCGWTSLADLRSTVRIMRDEGRL